MRIHKQTDVYIRVYQSCIKAKETVLRYFLPAKLWNHKGDYYYLIYCYYNTSRVNVQYDRLTKKISLNIYN